MQSETPQLLISGAADVAAGVGGSMAAAMRPLQAVELIEDEGGVVWVLEGGEG